MPRRSAGARLYLHPTERTWLIRDGSVTRRTGCPEADREGAEGRLNDYRATRYAPPESGHRLAQVKVADVLIAYAREHAPHTRSPETIGYHVDALGAWWGGRLLSDINARTCRAYVAAREKKVARRELETLGAAINHWHREHGPLQAVPVVTLPEKAPPRDRWLTRSDAARLLAGALGWRATACDRLTRLPTQWRRLHAPNRHVARFILLGLYTGTRHGALLALHWLPSTRGGWIDLERGVMHRRAQGKTESRKRQPPVRLGRRILAHCRRWHGLDAVHGVPLVVHYNGQAILKERRAWNSAVDRGALPDDLTPHVLRHTRATWMMQAGVDRWEAAGALGMSAATLEAVYGHHSPDFQRRAAEV